MEDQLKMIGSPSPVRARAFHILLATCKERAVFLAAIVQDWAPTFFHSGDEDQAIPST